MIAMILNYYIKIKIVIILTQCSTNSCLSLQQRNLKQKFIALLKRRFRVSEDLDQDQEEIGQKLSGNYPRIILSPKI